MVEIHKLFSTIIQNKAEMKQEIFELFKLFSVAQSFTFVKAIEEKVT
jgi:hypothetical protein